MIDHEFKPTPVANNIERLELLKEFWTNCLKEGDFEDTPLDEAVFQFIAETQDAYKELQEIEEGLDQDVDPEPEPEQELVEVE